MKKLSIFIVFLSAFLLTPISVFAQNVNITNRPRTIVTVSTNEVINQDYFAVGDEVDIFGTVNGDVYVAGGQVIINGIVNGDVLAAGGSIDISGKISQNVRIIGGQITVNGDIGRNLSIAGGNIQVNNSAKIGGNVVLAGGNISVSTPISKNLTAAVGNLVLSNDIKGNVNVADGNLHLTPKAHVFGNLTYLSKEKVTIDAGAKVDGSTVQNIPPIVEIPQAQVQKTIAGFVVFAEIFSFISSLIIGLLLILFLPKFSLNVAQTINDKTWTSLGLGLLALIITPILAIVLFATIIGIVPGVLLFVWYFVSLYTARIFSIYFFGSKISKWIGREETGILALIIGLVVYYLIAFIPVIGSLFKFILVLFGLGALVIAKREAYLAGRDKKII
jgi:hypothetical protein